MALDYRPLWHQLVDKEMNKTQLMKAAGITSNIVARMTNKTYVNLESIEKICLALDCNIEDVVRIVPDKQENETTQENE